jgi:hypothetical protein
LIICVLLIEFFVRVVGVVGGWKKEKIMNRGRRGMTLKEYDEIEKMGRCEDGKM